MTKLQRDPVVGPALDRLPVPEHRPEFWNDLFRSIRALEPPRAPDAEGVQRRAGGVPADDGPATADVVRLDDGRARLTGRRTAVRVAAAVAASLVVLAVVVGLGQRRNDAPPTPDIADETPSVGEADPPADPSTTDGPVDDPGLDEARQRVLGFLDALGRGDTERAATFVGAVSEQRAEDAGGLDSLLRDSAEGHGAWAAADPDVTTIGISSGIVVVVLEGDLAVEGTTEHRVAAFPVRKAESAGAWFVEPWAYDMASAPPMRIAAPEVDDEERAVVSPGDDLVVEATAPASGTTWLASDDGSLSPVDLVASGGRAVWRPGHATELVTVVYVDGPTLWADGFRVVRP